MRARVEAALHEVPESFRTVLILREIEGFAYDEIAEILDINMGTVKSRLLRGRAAMRQALEAREALESEQRAAASKRATEKWMEAAR